MNILLKYLSLFAVLALALTACSSGSQSSKEFKPWATDVLARDMDSLKNFSIVLYDMDITPEGQHRHRYKIIVDKNYQAAKTPAPAPTGLDSSALVAIPSSDSLADSDQAALASLRSQSDSSSATSPADSSSEALAQAAKSEGIETKITDWIPVSKEEFTYHSNNMGMEVLSKEEGEISKVPAPAGYNRYVGNGNYGQWQQNPQTGETFWSFYGKYMFMQSMFNMLSPPRYYEYNDYRNNYRGNRPFYGSGGVTRYGTSSRAVASTHPHFSSRMNSNPSFKERVGSSINESKTMPVVGQRSSSNSRTSSRFGNTNNSRYERKSASGSSSSDSKSSAGSSSSSSSSRRSTGRDAASSSSSSSRSSVSSGSSSSSASKSSSSSSSSRRSSSSSSSSSSRRSSGGRRR